jgi:nucleoside-diphosphate-sugar epimerase
MGSRAPLMRSVLVTGAAGRVGRRVTSCLRADGWAVCRFDVVDGDDVLDEAAVSRAARGSNAIVHTAAIAHDTAGTPAQIVATNVLGTWNVLLAAEAHAASRVVVFSSAQVFGFAEGEGPPAYVPVDDRHPVRASRPYGMSKRLTEDMCAAWTARTAIPTVVLRPVMILDDDDLRTVDAGDVDLGAFVHVRDVADAVSKALTASLDGHVRAILCGPGDFDTTVAREILGWKPTRGWPDA